MYNEAKYGKMYRPGRLVIIFTIVNIVNYADRGVMAGVVSNLGCPCSCEKGSGESLKKVHCPISSDSLFSAGDKLDRQRLLSTWLSGH